MKKCYKEMVGDAKSIGIYFNKAPEATLGDLLKRKQSCQKRAYRIPYSVLSPFAVELIKYG